MIPSTRPTHTPASQAVQGCITWQRHPRPQLGLKQQPLTAYHAGLVVTLLSAWSIQQLVPWSCSFLGSPSAVQLFQFYCHATPVCSAWCKQALNKPLLYSQSPDLLHWAWQPFSPTSKDTYGWSEGASGVALAR